MDDIGRTVGERLVDRARLGLPRHNRRGSRNFTLVPLWPIAAG